MKTCNRYAYTYAGYNIPVAMYMLPIFFLCSTYFDNMYKFTHIYYVLFFFFLLLYGSFHQFMYSFYFLFFFSHFLFCFSYHIICCHLISFHTSYFFVEGLTTPFWENCTLRTTNPYHYSVFKNEYMFIKIK